MSRYLGIDPGAKGAFCLLDSVTKVILFTKTPQKQGDAAILLTAIEQYHAMEPIQMIGLEDVHSIQGTSAKSNFAFGYNLGQVNTIAELTGIGVDLIQPKVWQKGCGVVFKAGLKPIERKRIVATTAIRLYPSAALYGPQGGLLDGRADALMIAHYLLTKYGGHK